MDSKQGKLSNQLLALVHGCYGVLHVKVKNTGAGVSVGYGDGTASWSGRRGHDGTGEVGGGRGW